jgi:predicted PurR-regulated permease PerM
LILISPFIIAIIFGGTVALAIYPLQLKLESIGIVRKRAAAILTTVFTFLISIPFFFFLIQGTIAVTGQLEKFHSSNKFQNQGMQNMVRTLRHDLVEKVHEHAAQFEIAQFLTLEKIDQYLNTTTTYLLKFFQGFAANLPVVFLLFLIMVVCLYSFLTYAHEVKKFFQSLFGFSDARTNELAAIFVKDSRQVYVSNIATGGVQSLIVATAVALTGIGDFFFVFFITLILSFIPVVGAAPVAFMAALIAYFQGDSTIAILLGVVGGLSGIIDNILRPYLASMGESKIPAVASFICVLGGAILLGFPGLFIGILIGSIAYDTLPIFWEELKSESFLEK